MIAVLIAGGKAGPKDPLRDLTRSGFKALLDLNGRPMAQWTLDALDASPSVEAILVVGLPEGSLQSGRKPLSFLDDQGGIIQNLLAGARRVAQEYPAQTHALSVSADIPGILPEMVEWVAARVLEAPDNDLYYNVVSRQTIERVFPGSRRTYLRFKDVEVCGGDLNAIRLSLMKSFNPLFYELVELRKNPLRQAAILGYDTLLGILLRVLTCDQAVARVTRRLGVKGVALHCPYAEIGMDVDKPFQYEMMRDYLNRRNG